MGHKIFVSYKYADADVHNITGNSDGSTVRDYVDHLESKLDENDHIYKGEEDDEDLSSLGDDTIWEKLKDRIYDSTLTIVFISPGMRESSKNDRDQWIPWEVSYSLKETSRRDSSGAAVSSKTNAMIAVVLPDTDDSYSYYLEDKKCCTTKCICHHTNKLFDIIRKNKFNYKKGQTRQCDSGGTVWSGKASYIEAVKWCNFIDNIEHYINEAYDRQSEVDQYTLCKEVE
jgi:hypothetical protein